MEPKLLSSSHWTVFATDKCDHCKRAIELILARNTSDGITVLNARKYSKKFQANDWKTVPQIYHGVDHIGGADKLAEYLK